MPAERGQQSQQLQRGAFENLCCPLTDAKLNKKGQIIFRVNCGQHKMAK